MGCSRCHDHKYDPITMKDFYSLFAFFNNVPEKGKDGDTAPTPNMNVYTGGSSQEHDRLQAEVDRRREETGNFTKTHRGAFEQWKSEEAERLASEIRLPAARAHYPFDFPVGKTLPNLARPNEDARIRGRENFVKSTESGKFGKAVTFANAGHVRLGSPFGEKGFLADSKISWSFHVKPLKDATGDVVSSLSSDKRQRGYRISLIQAADQDDLAVVFRLMSDQRKGKGIEVRTPPMLKRGAQDFTHVAVTYDGSLTAGGVTIYVDGQPVQTQIISDTLESGFATQDDHLLGSGLSFAVIDELYIHRSHVLSPEAVAALSQWDSATVILASTNPTAAQQNYLERSYFDSRDPGYQTQLAKRKRAENVLAAFERANITKVSIMEEMPEPRDSYLLLRGAYDKPDTSEKLSPQTFESLPPMADGLPQNRLGLARWLFQADNPLTARVAVNRYWQMLFGTGLVRTPEDFGSQGSPPTHPELLDWLAVEFRESGWDVKAMLKRIVTSETYCQDSRVTAEMLEKDPANEWLARGARRRLSAFTIRDQALAASGLLVNRFGGPPVMPFQPAGLWEEVSAKGFKYIVAKDDGLYRRSLYTFWRRTVPPPNMMNFDSVGREACSVNVKRTNTPLQAMNLLNDPQFVEAAGALGKRMMESGTSAEARIKRCSELLLARPPTDQEMKVFRAGYDHYLSEFRRSPESAKAFLSAGNSTPNPELDASELAACAAVANVFLNLDETVTKE